MGNHYFCTTTDYYVTFDGTIPLGGSSPLNAGTYSYYCEPHGSGMTGTIQVNRAATSVSLTVGSPNPSVINQFVNGFTVTVSNASGTGIIPSGQARLLIDGIAVTGFQSLNGSGQFTFNGITFSSSGNHNVTAQYQDPTGNFSSNTSNTQVQQVQDFSINVSNPAGSALPCPGGPICPPGQDYNYTGTVSDVGGLGFSGQVTISCQPGATAVPSSCVVTGNPVSVPGSFSVRASNTVAAPTFQFNIQGDSSPSGVAISHIYPPGVTLNVGSFTLNALNPTSVSAVQGNPSNTTAFSISSLGAFSGPITISCLTPPVGVSCFFSNGAATQVLGLGTGQTINDTLTLNTSSTLAAGPYTITVQASPISGPSQTRNLTLNESGGTRANTFIYFGTTPSGTTQTFANPAQTLLLNTPVSFSVSASNEEVSTNSTNVNVTLVFVEPFKSASANITFGAGGVAALPVRSRSTALWGRLRRDLRGSRPLRTVLFRFQAERSISRHS